MQTQLSCLIIYHLLHCSFRFSLKTRWTTKSDQKTVFTDTLHLYLCGLASSHCTQALVQLARASCGTGAHTWVQKRQALVLKLLRKKCSSNTLTGPKVEWKVKTKWILVNIQYICTVVKHFLSVSFVILPSHTFPDTGALPLCSREPGPPTGQGGCGCEIHPGVAQHPLITKRHRCTGFCS